MTAPPPTDRQGRWKLWMLWALALWLALAAWPQTVALMNFQPLGIDFLPLWTAGRMAWTAPGKVYDFAAVTKDQLWLLPHLHFPRPYAYPPSALLFLAPLGRLPFWTAQWLWVALGLGVFLASAARLAKASRALVVALAAVAPPVVLAVEVGQTVLLAAGLVTLAVAELKGRPRLAGALLALAAALKPQALLLAPVALAAGGAFEALASAAVVGAALVALSAAVFGPARWIEWVGTLQPFQVLIGQLPGMMKGVITPYGAAFDLGLAGPAMLAWRGAFALAGVGLVCWGFRRTEDPARRLAALLGGGLLISPYAMHYDGSLLVPAAVALAVNAVKGRGWLAPLLALLAVCEVATPYIGLLFVLAFILLTAVDLRVPRVAGASPAP